MGVVQGTNPLSYVGVAAPNPANVIPAQRAPLTTDINYAIGTLWVDVPNDDSYQLTSVVANVANWTFLGSAATPVNDVPHGGTGRNTLTNHGVLVGAGVNPITQLAVGATGTVLAGSTGADPAFTATPSVTSLTATTISGTTINTNVAAAEVSITGTTVGVDGTDANISLNLASKGSGSLVFSRSAAAVDLNEQITNSDNTSGTSQAGLQIATGGASGGDPYVSFQISGVGASTMTMGLDNSSSDTFVISNSTAIGTSNALTLTQAGALNATTSITAGTTLTATLGDIQATNGNLVLNTAGNKIISSSVATTTAAGANSFGTVTLVGGTATISTTSVNANSKIVLSRQSIGATGAAALGILTVGTITANTSFDINSVQAADATALQASDVSVIFWMLIN